MMNGASIYQQMMQNQMAAGEQRYGLGLNDPYRQLVANQVKTKPAETVTVRVVEKERTNLLLPIIAFALGAVLF